MTQEPDRATSGGNGAAEQGSGRSPMGTQLPSAADFPFIWQRHKVCPDYSSFSARWGSYGVLTRKNADEDDRGGTTAYEVWHWPSNTAESDWFTYADAIKEARRLYAAERWPEGGPQ